MNRRFFARRSLLILVVIFFLVPFAFRGARLSLRSMKNGVRVWLPSSFPETVELDWFRRHFLGEQFVICSWEGCTASDQRLHLLADKLLIENARVEGLSDEENARLIDRERSVAENHGLFVPENDYQDWGGSKEKWFQGRGTRGTTSRRRGSCIVGRGSGPF
jgi:hypothetical protein